MRASNRSALIPLIGLAAVALAAVASDESSRGSQLFTQFCTGCHGVETDNEGPRLRGVFGRRAGSVEGFQYSEALKNARFTWNTDTLKQWLTDPGKLVPGTDMKFRVPDADARDEIVRYLERLSTADRRAGGHAFRKKSYPSRTTELVAELDVSVKPIR